MSNIYQEIWNADQEDSGVAPILQNSGQHDVQGYVVVDEKSASDGNHSLFKEVHIPDNKAESYNLCKKLFNNYTLDQTKRENDTMEELDEVDDFIDHILSSGPMQVAREYISFQTGKQYNDHRWYELIKQLWFTTYKQGSNPSLSGFEHILVGEQKKGKAGGYHFWYKYFLDDSAGLSGSDDILYNGTKGGLQDENLLVPEVSTISYTWMAYDYEAGERRKLFKKIGGFFNGCSAEGLMALGTVRGHFPARAPKEAVINGSRYGLRVYHNDPSDPFHLRTFYPEFLGMVGDQADQPDPKPIIPTNNGGVVSRPVQNTDGSDGSVRIVGALVNPEGHDPGMETVTLVNTSAKDIDLVDWFIEDKNGNSCKLQNENITCGQFLSITLKENTAQLSNKGGVIKLYNAQAALVHSVSYTGEQVRAQGKTILFK